MATDFRSPPCMLCANLPTIITDDYGQTALKCSSPTHTIQISGDSLDDARRRWRIAAGLEQYQDHKTRAIKEEPNV